MATGNRIESQLSQFKAIAYRLSSTPVANLPRLLPLLSQSLASHKNILSAPHAPSSDAAVIIHQLKTRTSSLLQDRSLEGRFAGVVLVKCLVDAGAWEFLHTSANWIRGVISILNRSSEPTATRKLCIVTLTRIFQSSHEYENLVRELTTPNLPQYITACLNALQRKDGQVWKPKQKKLLETILRSWAELMPKHSTIFRPFISQIQNVTGQINGLHNWQLILPQDVSPGSRDAALKVHVLLHGSATKTGGLEDRDTALMKLVHALQSNTAEIFENLYGRDDLRVQSFTPHTIGAKLELDDIRALQQINDLLRLVSSYITTASSKRPAQIPIGLIVSLMRHIAPFSNQDSKHNSKLTKNARQSLLTDLPALHTTVLRLAYILLRRFGNAITSYARDLLKAVVDIFHANYLSSDIAQEACFVIKEIIVITGYGMAKKKSAILHSILQKCCQTIAPLQDDSQSQSQPSTSANQKGKITINANTIIGAKRKVEIRRASQTPLQQAAADLLTEILLRVPADNLPPNLRIEIDRTIILTRNNDALFASVLNPAKRIPSMMPFFARIGAGSTSIEAILRPRMPVISGRTQNPNDEEEEEEEQHAVTNGTYAPLSQISTSAVPPPQELSTTPMVIDNNTLLVPTSPITLTNGKHALPDDTLTQSSPKKPKFDLSAFSNAAQATQPSHFEATAMPSVIATSPQPTNVNPIALFAAESGQSLTIEVDVKTHVVGEVEVEDEDEDESDFEMPTLVLARDGEDDDDSS